MEAATLEGRLAREELQATHTHCLSLQTALAEQERSLLALRRELQLRQGCPDALETLQASALQTLLEACTTPPEQCFLFQHYIGGFVSQRGVI